MHIALACAGRRGLRFLRRLTELAPGAHLTVFSFREEPVEPPFLDDIRDLAGTAGARFLEVRKLDGPRGLAFWETADVDLLLVVGWRYLISPRVYCRPRRGAFVLHDSLLPRYRGFSPTVWAICNGEGHTGATLFAIAEDVDCGDVVGQESVPIGPADTIAVVAERVTEAYLRLLEQHLQALLAGTAVSRPQDHAAATYVPKRRPEDNRIDWTGDAERAFNLIRAVTRPYGGAFTHVRGRRLRLWSADRVSEPAIRGGRPGDVLDVLPGTGAVVATGNGAVLLRLVQWDEGPVLCAADALAGASERLGA